MNASPADQSLPGPARSVTVEVDLDAIRDNVAELNRRAGDAEVLAVVKADAYGHGLVPSARAALAGGATWLGVAQLDEAIRLRRSGVDALLLTWLYPPGADLTTALDLGIDVTVSSVAALTELLDAADATGATARVHLKVDTGLSRNGAVGAGWVALLDAAADAEAEESVDIVGVWSHFAYADQPTHPTVLAQQERFEEALADVARAGLRPAYRHLANSAATLTNPSAHYDLVRPGLAVYGLSPVPDLGGPADFGLREAMRVTAPLTLTKSVPAGTGVSYGHTYTTAAPTTLGLVPMGYADGVPRAASNVGPVQVGGRWLRVAGRVCMDQFVLDLGAEYAGGPGDEVVVMGRSGEGEPTAQDWAEATDTINYEIATRMAPHTPRTYVGDPALVAHATGQG